MFRHSLPDSPVPSYPHEATQQRALPAIPIRAWSCDSLSGPLTNLTLRIHDLIYVACVASPRPNPPSDCTTRPSSPDAPRIARPIREGRCFACGTLPCLVATRPSIRTWTAVPRPCDAEPDRTATRYAKTAESHLATPSLEVPRLPLRKNVRVVPCSTVRHNASTARPFRACALMRVTLPAED